MILQLGMFLFARQTAFPTVNTAVMRYVEKESRRVYTRPKGIASRTNNLETLIFFFYGILYFDGRAAETGFCFFVYLADRCVAGDEESIELCERQGRCIVYNAAYLLLNRSSWFFFCKLSITSCAGAISITVRVSPIGADNALGT